MAKSKFVIQDPNRLNLQFYESYDASFLLRKADTLFFITENLDSFKLFVSENNGDQEGLDAKFVETLRAEIHFTEFHQFEAFFALLIAIFQDLPHWLYLTDYDTREIKGKTQAFLDKDYGSLTNGKISTLNDFLNVAVYADFVSDLQEHKENWEINLNNIAWLLNRMATKYLEGTEYNAYKHGLRILTGHTYLKISPTGSPDQGLQFASDDSLRFLELEKMPEQDLRLVRQTYKHFNPIESINHLTFMTNIIETIKAVRLARIKGEQHTNLNVFIRLDRDVLSKEIVMTKWSVPT